MGKTKDIYFRRIIKYIEGTIKESNKSLKNTDKKMNSLFWWCIIWNIRMIFHLSGLHTCDIPFYRIYPDPYFFKNTEEDEVFQFTMDTKIKNFEGAKNWFETFHSVNELNNINKSQKVITDGRTITEKTNNFSTTIKCTTLYPFITEIIQAIVATETFQKSEMFKNLKIYQDLEGDMPLSFEDWLTNKICDYDPTFFLNFPSEKDGLQKVNLFGNNNSEDDPIFSLKAYSNNAYNSDGFIYNHNIYLTKAIYEELEAGEMMLQALRKEKPRKVQQKKKRTVIARNKPEKKTLIAVLNKNNL